MRARRRPRTAAFAAGLVLLVAACASEPEVIDVAEEGEARTVTTGEVDVHDVQAPADVPPRDADLHEGGWPEAAAWIAREVDEGRPVLVNIFASWCDPCRREMPMLIEASRQHPDVAFLGIDHLDPIEQGRGFVEEFGIPFATIHDLGGDVAAAVGSRGMPTTVVFDREGRLAGRVVGELTERTMNELLDEVR